jgi:DNA repair protein RecN (Recombination protein N)
VAQKLAKQVQQQLADLGMKDARLTAELSPVSLGDDALRSEVPSWGADELELTLAANPGEPAQPLRKVASGGELSRTMLALKTVLAKQDRTGSLVFDEIDSNVGGRLGDVLGQKLAALGQTHQVICVTHLPQVASYARHHWTIRKTKAKGRTVTQIAPLAEAERLDELASMLRGEARSETTRQEAEAMLRAGRRCW